MKSLEKESEEDVQNYNKLHKDYLESEKALSTESLEQLRKEIQHIEEELKSVSYYFFPQTVEEPKENATELCGRKNIIVVDTRNEWRIILPENNTFKLPTHFTGRHSNCIRIPYIVLGHEKVLF